MARHSDRSVLAVNVGNGLTRFGAYVAEELVGTWEASTTAHLTVDEARSQARSVLGELLPGTTPDGAVLACVVPQHAAAWAAALSGVASSRALVVGPGLKCGVRMRQDDPAGVGADRVANVAGAQALLGSPVVVVSLGTTTNVEVVGEDGSFLGGAISPGLTLGVRALATAAARLPMVELGAPSSVIGRNTHDAMQSGVVLGEVALLDGLIDKVFDELGYEAPVVVTGHHAGTIAGLMQHDALVDEPLTLRGLARIWYLNRG